MDCGATDWGYGGSYGDRYGDAALNSKDRFTASASQTRPSAFGPQWTFLLNRLEGASCVPPMLASWFVPSF